MLLHTFCRWQNCFLIRCHISIFVHSVHRAAHLLFDHYVRFVQPSLYHLFVTLYCQIDAPSKVIDSRKYGLLFSAMSHPPPSPSHILRGHIAQVNALWFSDDNERLYSGDAAGAIVITSTRTLRPLAAWNAHTDGILGVQELEDRVITSTRQGQQAAPAPGLQTPTLCYSMDVNALNYCRFSLLALSETARTDECRALIALPNLVDSSVADVWTLPSMQRLHAAIGKTGQRPSSPNERNALGIIMSMHLFEAAHPHIVGQIQLRLLCGYENGSVSMWAYTRRDKETSVEGIGWDSLWSVKLHVETIMAMTVSRDNSFALTVSADHLVGRYDIQAAGNQAAVQIACTVHRTKHPGNGSIAIRDDGKVCAIGGWDGKIRLYSTKTMKSLGTLDYHKKSCQVLAFARSEQHSMAARDDTDSDDEMGSEEKAERCRWLASGSQDHRVAIWTLINFGKT
ncbi:ASTRA-associated protein 1 [Grifola frondosa]|uniref:ASTRA-associated protein 1 n=1 Tax=Grifola frondosa TaxID=5627 RepID=A0A1C7M532_GRIFR|nr:ASTRA-associated protein 1 [Grifola frondosa]